MADLAEDSEGPSIILIAVTEGGIYLPSLALSTLTFLRFSFGGITCNTKAALELYLLLMVLSSLFVVVFIAPCATEAISSGHTLAQGLAHFHGSPTHRLMELHLLADFVLLVYGALAVLTTNSLLCSMRFPRAVAGLLLLQLGVLVFRTLEHVILPWCVNSYNRRHPLDEAPGSGRAGNHNRPSSFNGNDGDEYELNLERIRAIIDYNFHRIQQSYTYRERLPRLREPSAAQQSPPAKRGHTKRTAVVTPTSIVVRPRSSASDSKAELAQA